MWENPQRTNTPGRDTTAFFRWTRCTPSPCRSSSSSGSRARCESPALSPPGQPEQTDPMSCNPPLVVVVLALEIVPVSWCGQSIVRELDVSMRFQCVQYLWDVCLGVEHTTRVVSATYFALVLLCSVWLWYPPLRGENPGVKTHPREWVGGDVQTPDGAARHNFGRPVAQRLSRGRGFGLATALLACTDCC